VCAGGSVYDQSLIMHTDFYFVTSDYIADISDIHSILALFSVFVVCRT